MTLKQSNAPANYAYVNARVRARRAKLFDDEEYRNLVRMGTSEIARYMEESEYQEEINRMGSRYSGVDLIEYALNRNMARHFDDLLRYAEGQLYREIARYLRKFDAWNVKTILRGIYSGVDSEEIETDLIRAGEFDDDRIDELLAASTVEDAIEALDGTVFDDPLEEAYDEYERSGTLVPLENAVDRAFYENLLGEVQSWNIGQAKVLYVEFLRAEIDFRNVRNALRLARSQADVDPSEYHIEGGRLFSESDLAAVGHDTDQIVARVRDSVYGDRLEEALDNLEEADSLSEFENALEAALLSYSGRLSTLYPMSICPVLAYVLAKEREVKNVRAIARGKEAGLDPDEIERELVIV